MLNVSARVDFVLLVAILGIKILLMKKCEILLRLNISIMRLIAAGVCIFTDLYDNGH